MKKKLKNLIKNLNEVILVIFSEEIDDVEKEKKIIFYGKSIVIDGISLIFFLVIIFIFLFSIYLILKSFNMITELNFLDTLTDPKIIIFTIVIFSLILILKNKHKYSGLNHNKIDQLVHNIFFINKNFQLFFYNLEKFFYKKTITVEQEPIFISTLARGGSTALLNAIYSIPQVNSHTYKSMPLILSPRLSRIIFIFLNNRKFKVERAHKDGHLINQNSPEAFEEVIWKFFFKEKINEKYISSINSDYKNINFEDFFKNHINSVALLNEKVLFRENDFPPRYCSKNNSNISRILYLKKIFPKCKILVIVRDPISHSSSLLNQHINFIKLQKENPFVLKYMDDIGHYDFGLNYKTISFEKKFFSKYKLDSINYWLDYWCYIFGNILNFKNSINIILLEDLLNDPNRTMKKLLKIVNLDVSDSKDYKKFFDKKNIQFKFQNKIEKSLLLKANKIYTSLKYISI